MYYIATALPEETLGLLIAAKRIIENQRNATGPVLLKLDTIIQQYYSYLIFSYLLFLYYCIITTIKLLFDIIRFKVHSFSDQIKIKEINTKEHYTDAVRHLASVGLLHLHGPSPIVQPYSLFSARFDPAYLTSVIDSLDINPTLKKWSKTWLE